MEKDKKVKTAAARKLERVKAAGAYARQVRAEAQAAKRAELFPVVLSALVLALAEIEAGMDVTGYPSTAAAVAAARGAIKTARETGAAL